MTYQVGDLVYTTHMGDVYKCVVTATNSNIYTVEPIEGGPGAFIADRHVDRLTPQHHTPAFTVDDRAILLGRGMWSEIAADCDWNNRKAKERRRLNDAAIVGTICEHCGDDYRYGNHEPVYGFNKPDPEVEETYHCQYPQEIDF